MKIGIMTYWWSKDNYGQQLQCYALQKYLQNLGHDAYLIRYNASFDYSSEKAEKSNLVWRKIVNAFNPVKIYKYLLKKRRKAQKNQENMKNDIRKFEEFRSMYLRQSEEIYYHYTELEKGAPEADIYIAGSDQVWNPDYIKSIETQARAFFLDFGNPLAKRVSYAASFGKEILEKEFLKKIAPFLQKFDYVSVREKSGIDICKQCGVSNAEWAPDPTMLLDMNSYRTLYKNEPMQKMEMPYVFLYLLSGSSNFSLDTIYDWAKRNKLKVVYISGNSMLDNNKIRKFYATIPEWIYLLEHAEYVITNSYHCAVFSLLFKKKFGIIPRSGSHRGMNTRFDSLFEYFQMEKRYIVNFNSDISNSSMDWNLISSIFQKIRNESILLNLDRIF